MMEYDGGCLVATRIMGSTMVDQQDEGWPSDIRWNLAVMLGYEIAGLKRIE